MTDWIARIPYRRTLFVVFSLFVFASSAEEIVSEFMAGERWRTMADDLAMFASSGVLVLVFGLEYLSQRRALGELRDQLDSARGQLVQLDANSRQIARQYRDVIQMQFDQWQLTASEQEVVLALLKGLSFREVAELRETREKTVRQQAINVYRKAGVAGRHELAAWFFEDMLEPPTVAPTDSQQASTSGNSRM